MMKANERYARQIITSMGMNTNTPHEDAFVKYSDEGRPTEHWKGECQQCGKGAVERLQIRGLAVCASCAEEFHHPDHRPGRTSKFSPAENAQYHEEQTSKRKNPHASRLAATVSMPGLSSRD